MDWKYKHFSNVAIFSVSRESLLDVARAIVAQSLPNIEDTSDGFVAHGSSAWHAATATFKVETTSEGTRVNIELLVERASVMGFMLVDIGGYYNGQIRRWLLGISQQLGQQPVTVTHPRSDSKLRRGCLTGCAVYFVIGVCLSLIAIPLDRVVFPQISSSSSGPFLILASAVGLLSGIAALIYEMNSDVSLWSSIRARVQGTQNKNKSDQG